MIATHDHRVFFSFPLS